MADRPADTKRVKISKAQKITLLEVLAASLILGTCLVVINFLVKYINFNAKIITAKSSAVVAYDKTIRDVGICADSDRNGRLTDAEIEACNPNTTALNAVINSLRYNIYETMAQNEDLESVARKRNENGICYNDDDGSIKDFSSLYMNALTEAERQQALQGMKLCSSLRVISDALPAQKNVEALMASLNQIFITAGVEPQSIAPADETVSVDIQGVGAIPVTFRVEGSGATIIHVLDSIEDSIREFDITSALIEWSSGALQLRANANAFYLSENKVLEGDIMVRAGDRARK